MSQDLKLKLDGIKSYPSPLTAPPGALDIASNVVISREDTIESRRGFKRYNPVLTGTINNIFEYKDILYTAYDNKLAKDVASVWTDQTGGLTAPNSYRIKSAQQNQNLYLTSDEGIKKVDVTNSAVIAAGVPKGIPMEGVISAVAMAWFPKDSEVAYRVVWTIEDENNNLLIGTPSSRLVLINANMGGAASEVDLTIYIPSGITVDYKYQLYRSQVTGTEGIIPDDELQLVREANPTAGEITAGEILWTDAVEEGNRGAFLYTSPSQDGILKSNDIPPLAQDITSYKNTVFYANTKYFHSILITLDQVGAGFLAAADSVTIDGTTFTAVGSAPAAEEFVVFTSGADDAANVAQTAINLCIAINKSAVLTTVEAHYTGTPSQSPGNFQLTRVALDAASFVITASSSTAGDAFTPALPTSGNTVISDNNEKKNRIYVSKRNQPEGVPLLNFFNVGSAEHGIDRIVSLSDAVFIFKKDGIFRTTGEIFENFRTYSYDDTNILVAPDSAVTYNDAVFCFTNQGIMAITSGSPALVSKDIHEEILEKVNFTDIDIHTFGVSYETDKKYILFTLVNSGDSPANIAYVYDSITRAWTTWDLTQRAGFINPEDDKLYLCGDDKFIRQERKTFMASDYSEDEFAVTITAYDSQFLVTLASVADVVVGQSLSQSGKTAKITNIAGLDITLNALAPWDLAAATVHNPIAVEIKWLPQYADNPGYNKRWQEVSFFFRDMALKPVTIGFTSNFSPTKETIELSANNSSPWGGFTWGAGAWGGGVSGQQPLRTYFPREKSMALFAGISIEHDEAFVRFATNGASIISELMDTRFK